MVPRNSTAVSSTTKSRQLHHGRYLLARCSQVGDNYKYAAARDPSGSYVCHILVSCSGANYLTRAIPRESTRSERERETKGPSATHGASKGIAIDSAGTEGHW